MKIRKILYGCLVNARKLYLHFDANLTLDASCLMGSTLSQTFSILQKKKVLLPTAFTKEKQNCR